MPVIARPADSDYPIYYQTYTRLVPDGDILATLAGQHAATLRLLEGATGERERFRYAEGKWSVRESIGHCIDTERLFAFRALWMARGAAGAQPGMEQDDWVAASNAGERPLADLAAEWAALRADVVTMFRSLDATGLARTGTASGGTFTAGSFAWIIAGHELHHRRLLAERYGLGG